MSGVINHDHAQWEFREDVHLDELTVHQHASGRLRWHLHHDFRSFVIRLDSKPFQDSWSDRTARR
jgi:hypothetical protein